MIGLLEVIFVVYGNNWHWDAKQDLEQLKKLLYLNIQNVIKMCLNLDR